MARQGRYPAPHMDALPVTAELAPDPARGPMPTYRARLGSGQYAPDPAQALIMENLQELWFRLRGYAPRPAESGGILSRLFRKRASEDGAAHAPIGLYIVGAVGRGKSMLMDLFFEAADVRAKRRIHFHSFMQQAHQRIHAWRQANPGLADPIPPLAEAIAAEAVLLCFDEFQVHDISDAMILGRLFDALFARGVVVVATSNTAPDDLFRGQPGRDAFLPFIAEIKRHVEVLHLESPRDYRRDRVRALPSWHSPADGRAERAMDASFEELTGTARAAPTALVVLNREVVVPQTARGVARFDFNDLCGRPLGPADYRAVAQTFHTVLIDGIPRLSPENFDKARRFITLIDALYEAHCKLLASAEAPPDTLYQRGENAAMFERTASRLNEMQSQEYLALPHLTA